VEQPFSYVGSCAITSSLHRIGGLLPFFTKLFGALFWTWGVQLLLRRTLLPNVDLILLIGPGPNCLALGFRALFLLPGLVTLLGGPRKVLFLISSLSPLLSSFCSLSLHLSRLWLGDYFAPFNTMVSICYQKKNLKIIDSHKSFFLTWYIIWFFGKSPQ